MGIKDIGNLQSNPKLGASWEGFVVEQILNQLGDRDCYFWATHAGAELDLMLIRKGQKWGFEIKYADAPTLTKSMRIAKEDLKLKHLWVVYPGAKSYPLEKEIDYISLAELPKIAQKLS